MARKVPLITTHHIVICSCLLMIMAQYVALGQPVAKPGCPSRCGNITVPYPFGIGAAGCFLDKWFEIVCGNGTTPSLNGATDLVVTGISLDGTIRATRADWVENNTEQRRAFEGGPFELPGLVYAPMVIKWQLLNYTTFDVFGTSLVTNQTNSNSSRVYWDPQENAYRGGPPFVNSSCEFYNHTSSRLECSCPLGYEGNPYLINGCQDIDECDLTRNGTGRICTISGTECFNVGGGFLCTSMVRERASRVKPILIGIGCGLGALLMLIGSWGLYKLVKRRKEIQQKERFFKRNGGILLQQQLTHSDEVNVEKTKLYDSKELEKATDNFNASRILGQGGQGTVYKGMLVDGKIVAIKKSKILDEEKITEFINEVVILSQINHRNVVKLLGCCLETEVPLLVYEFIPNGTLSHYIHDPNEEVPLTWDLRLRIATEIAGALSYLHSSAAVPIYHRDIKSTNILLDEKFRAKVADFGTSRTISIDQTHLTTLVHGTFGYLDPEYFQSSQFTDKSDVYSFGVVLVELLSGQKPISKTRSNEDRSLATYFMLCMEENRLFDIVDPRIAKEGEKEAIVALATLARSCLNLNGRRRPTMREVATELERIQKSVQSSNGLQDFEVLEFVRDEVAEPEPFDLFASSVTWSDSRGDAGSSSGRPFLSHTGTMIDRN